MCKKVLKTIEVIAFIGIVTYILLVNLPLNVMDMVKYVIFCFTLLFLIVLPKRKVELGRLEEGLILFLFPFYIQWFTVGEWLIECRWMSLFIIIMTEMVWVLLVPHVLLAGALNATIYALLCSINDIVTKVRYNVLMPSDFLSLKTGFLVAEKYKDGFQIPFHVIISLLSIAILWMLYLKVQSLSHTKKIKKRFMALVTAILLYLVVSFFEPAEYVSGQYNSTIKTKRIGYVPFFYMEVKNLGIQKPKGYSEESCKQLLECSQPKKEKKEKPNIVVIMDEAFSDLSVIGNLMQNQDSLSFVHSAAEDSQFKTGFVYVPTWACNTCNTEWELLTGNSMVACSNRIPFTQFIKSPKYSLASELSEQGYQTIAVHPYYKKGYNRDEVYPFLGFDAFISLDDFDNRYQEMIFNARLSQTQIDNDARYVRDLISDSTSFRRVEELYEDQKESGPLFIFNLTMQNHAPYDYRDYDSLIRSNLEETHPDVKFVDQYLTLVSETDSALKDLFTYFSNVDEKTVIFVVGDHQPAIGGAFYNSLFGYEPFHDSKEWTEEEQRSRYKIPYLLWANYDLNLDSSYEALSSNFIHMLLLDALDMKDSAWYKSMRSLYEKFPIISCCGIMDSEGTWSDTTDPKVTEDRDYELYQQLQYYRMFDERF